jgi:hypothetical protein
MQPNTSPPAFPANVPPTAVASASHSAAFAAAAYPAPEQLFVDALSATGSAAPSGAVVATVQFDAVSQCAPSKPTAHAHAQSMYAVVSAPGSIDPVAVPPFSHAWPSAPAVHAATVSQLSPSYLGFGRIVALEKEVPSMVANLV